MPIHVQGKKGDVARIVLLPGDPQRAEYMAGTYLENAVKYTEYRLMYGFTGKYKGYDVSIQTTGMGTPSLSIVVEELVMLGAEIFIRVGTCGSIQDALTLGDVILSTGASSTHDIFSQRFRGSCFSAVPDFTVNRLLWETAQTAGLSLKTGEIVTSETFYEENMDMYRKFAEYGHLGIEMEAYALFGLAAKHGKKAATMLTVSDNIFAQKRADKEVILSGVDKMTRTVLDTVPALYKIIGG